MSVSIFLVAWLGLQSASVPTQNASIDGIVKDAVSNTPLYGVKVWLADADDKKAAVGPPLVTTITDDDGRFHISAPPADYTIRAQRDGYFGPLQDGVPAQNAAQRITLAAGQALNNATISLQAGGAITGQFLNEAGRPKSGMTVTALRFAYDNGRRVFLPARTAQTDDRGEYRLYWVPPGEYIISGSSQSNFTVTVTVPQPARLPVRTFFPGTTDPQKAVPVVVKPGSETAGNNFAVQTLQTVSVMGRVVNPFAPKPPEPVPGQTSSFIAPPRIALAPRGAAIDESLSSFGNNATAAESREGIFRIPGVLPGPYDLYVIASDGGSVFRTVAGARISLDVGNQDLTGLAVTVRAPVELKGRVIINGAGPRIDLPPLELRPIGNVPGTVRASVPPKVNIPPTGEFSIKNVLPGAYALDLNLPDGVFLADVRQGERSLYGAGSIAITGDPPEPLQITAGRNGGSIRGRIAVPEMRDVRVVLIPEPSLRANSALYRTARPSGDGTFQLKDIAPGNYKLFAWDGVLYGAWMNAEFLQRFEDRGMTIKVEPKETQLEEPITPFSQTN